MVESRAAAARAAEEARRRLMTAGALFAALLAFGIVGYVTIEGWSVLDAAYMTVTTVTTVGFREVKPLSDGGRVFTIFLILFGVGTALYIMTTAVSLVVEGDLAIALGVRRMRGKIGALKDHYILCGFGRVGEEIARDFTRRGVPFVVVESNPEAIQRAQAQNVLLVEGDAALDATLIEAGIQRARGLLAASDSDSGNTYITLTAKALNPRVWVVARAGKPESEERQRRAGADRVISPYSIGGRRMAMSALQPLMVDFIDTLVVGQHGERMLAEVAITRESRFRGAELSEVLKVCRNSVVLGIQKPGGDTEVAPQGHVRLELGDQLIIMGTQEDLDLLAAPRETPGRPADRGLETSPAEL